MGFQGLVCGSTGAWIEKAFPGERVLCRMLSARMPRWCVPVTGHLLPAVVCAAVVRGVRAYVSYPMPRPMACPGGVSHTCAARVPRSGVGCLVALLPSAPMTDRMLGCYPPKGARIRPTRPARPTSGAGRGRVPMGGDPHHSKFTTPQ